MYSPDVKMVFLIPSVAVVGSSVYFDIAVVLFLNSLINVCSPSFCLNSNVIVKEFKLFHDESQRNTDINAPDSMLGDRSFGHILVFKYLQV